MVTRDPLKLPDGFRIAKQLGLDGQWTYASSHYGWASDWFTEERRAVAAAKIRECYLRVRGREREVYP